MSDELREISAADAIEILAMGEVSIAATMPYSSNYTLLTRVEHNGAALLAIYKPMRGERPLWDFPRNTLYKREAAAYLVSELLDLGLVPPTVVRDGPYGVGSLQLFIDNDEEQHLFTMIKEGGYEREVRDLAAFDVLINNADRKSGHCLKAHDGRLWAIDHGICFHHEYKLRTVLWDFIGEAYPEHVLNALSALQSRIEGNDPAITALASLLERSEFRAFKRRLNTMILDGSYPQPGPGPNVPWPPV